MGFGYTYNNNKTRLNLETLKKVSRKKAKLIKKFYENCYYN